jgi:small GTP-binding protein
MYSHDHDLIEKDIEGYLAKHQGKELLRFVTVGSVDDGKSTLIGRLLHDTHGIYEDQLSAVKRVSAKRSTEIDFSLFTDGLKAEREQGITIDVAYRYFSTENRKFIIADTPGHVQYTRNMATGASTANVALILIDARLGVLPQSRRHAFIASLLGIPHLLVCVNKMDLVGFEAGVYSANLHRVRRVRGAPGVQVGQLRARERGGRGQRGAPERPQPLVRGSHRPQAPGDDPHRDGSQPRELPFPGAVRPAPEPRLPGLRGRDRLRRGARGRPDPGVAVSAAQPRGRHRHLRRLAPDRLRPAERGHPLGGRDRR